MTQFVSLHNQTTYSILDSIADVKQLFKKAKELGQKAIAITDHGTISSAWKALKVSKETGVKLIIGCEFYFKEENDEKLRHIIFLAKNQKGYSNLLTLNKKGFDNGLSTGKRLYPVINWNLVENHKDGLICITACGNGILSQLLMNKKNDQAEKTLNRLSQLFGDDLAIEIQPNNMRRGSNVYNDEIDQMFLNRQLINLGKKFNVKVIPACNTHYVEKQDASVHDVLLAIGSHQPIYSNFRLKYPVEDFYLKSGDEVKSFFSRNYGEEYSDQICANTIYFADKCEEPNWIDPKYSNPSGKELPIFPVKDEIDYKDFMTWLDKNPQYSSLEDDKNYLRYKAEQGLSRYFEKTNFDDAIKKIYIDRVEEELDVLYYCGVSSYMLIVADYISWCKNNGVSTGPGRGSVGGSFIGFLLGIHDADSIKYKLVFPRFFNKLKKSYADIDADFSKRNRGKVIDYIVEKYGKDNVAGISNLNTITPKVYVRDIARAHESGGSKEAAVKIGNDAADSIASDIKNIDDALEKSPIFAEYCKRYPELEKNKEICKMFRAWGTHAAGIIISQRPLTGLVPLRKDKDGNTNVEYEKETAEENGLVKMDILGLETLDTIDDTLRLIKAQGKEVPEINCEVYDQKTYDLITSGNTFGVFQFGTSQGTIDLCKKIKPKSIDDLAIITTLARPASKEIREDFIKVREGKKQRALLHPSLNNALKDTFGFPLYDESLLILAKDVAGWDYAEADKLRKLTKEKGKNPEKVKQWRKEFIEGATKNGVVEPIAARIWEEIIEPYGKYSFNCSHAVLYSMISYKTAYLKAHYPLEFLLATLMAEVHSNSQDSDDNIAKIKKEIRDLKIKILSPDINTSKLTYTIEDQSTLLTGLDALKSVGDDAIKDIIEKRPFKSFFDFMLRVDSSKVRANAIQALIASGALDSFKLSRKNMFLYCSDYRKKLQSWLKRHDPNTEVFEYPFPDSSEWSRSELFALETEYLGEGFICRPYLAYNEFFKQDHKLAHHIRKSDNKTKIFPVRAIVRDIFEFKVKKETSKYYGQSMIKCKIEDKTGDQISCTIFPDRYTHMLQRMKMINSKAKFESGLGICFGGTVNIYEEETGIILEELFDLSLPPQMPEDKKHKKISLRDTKPTRSDKNNNLSLEEKIEDELYDLGLIELEEVEDD